MTELASRAVACKHWRWLPGMWIVDEVGGRGVVLEVVRQGDQDYVKFQNPAHTRQGQVPAVWCVPDLADPATLGCLLALVKAAWGVGDVYLYPGSGQGDWWCSAGGHDFHAATEAEALVAALEAAP